MSPRDPTGPHDLPGRIVDLAVGLLSPPRRGWGHGMVAELAFVARGHRRAFALGCLAAVVRARAPHLVRYAAAAAAGVTLVVLLTRHTAYLPMRIGLVVMTAALVLLPLGLRLVGLSASWGAGPRLVRALGLALVGITVCLIVLDFRGGGGDQVSRTRTGLPIFTIILVIYLTGFVVLAARSLTPGPGPVCGLAGALGWTVVVLVAPPVPATTAGADYVLLAVGSVAAGWAGVRSSREALLAGLSAVMTAGLVIFVEVGALMDYGPDRFVPALVPEALTPASRISESRIEATDPYLGVLAIGCLAALALVVASLARIRPAPSPRVSRLAPWTRRTQVQ